MPIIDTFSQLDLPAPLLAAIDDLGFESPSHIQAATIPLLRAGKDVVGMAQTGTGKTAAFGLPMVAAIDPALKAPQALVLAPTRELALQVSEAVTAFARHLPQVRVLPIYGGQSYGVQIAGLKRGAQIIVGTPGRIIDHLHKGKLDLSQLRYLVLDEADEMLKMGFQEDVEEILSQTPEDKQSALFSATIPPAIRKISEKYLRDPEQIEIETKTTTNANIEQRYVVVSPRTKIDALTRILEVETFEAMILFVRTKQQTEEMADKLRARGFGAAAINGDMVQAQRERTINQLKEGQLDILVATDVAARGLDVDRITHVLNYDMPHDPESYVHRIGRTGRAGRAGQALLFVTPRERRMIRQIERVTGQPLSEINLPSVDDVNDTRVRRFNDSITEALASEHLDLFRGFVQLYAADNDIDMVDIAAALAVQSVEDADEFLLTEEIVVEEFTGRQKSFSKGGRRGDDRGKSRSGKDLVPYRIAVGKRHRAKPSSIVGAIANEGGISSADIGHISIRGDHSLVDLPADLSADFFEKLEKTRISGQLIHIEPDPGPPADHPAAHKRRKNNQHSPRMRDSFDHKRGRDKKKRDKNKRKGSGGKGYPKGKKKSFRDSRDNHRGQRGKRY
ncbi:MAG TPA: DEAD/DEAH box helicase [Corynebacteriales bacterium]|nr:DEAD/DEAH box helicase [Mycobacteriales bacterium]